MYKLYTFTLQSFIQIKPPQLALHRTLGVAHAEFPTCNSIPTVNCTPAIPSAPRSSSCPALLVCQVQKVKSLPHGEKRKRWMDTVDRWILGQNDRSPPEYKKLFLFNFNGWPPSGNLDPLLQTLIFLRESQKPDHYANFSQLLLFTSPGWDM